MISVKNRNAILIMLILICYVSMGNPRHQNLYQVTAEPNSAINPGFVMQFGSVGSGDGQFQTPTGIASNGTHFFVADSGNSRIQIFDMAGNFVRSFGGYGSNLGQFDEPVDVDINGTHIFVLDSYNHRIQIFDMFGNFTSSFGTIGSGDDQLFYPEGMAINSSHIFVVNGENNIKIFDHNGNFIRKFGSYGSAIGQFDYATAIDINSTHIFVLDPNNNRIQIFDMVGNFISEFGSYGSAIGQFNVAYDLEINDNRILVTDAENYRVQIFDISGNYITQFGTEGDGEGQFGNTVGVQAIGANNDYIIVSVMDVDPYIHQLMLFQKYFPPHNLSLIEGVGSISFAWESPSNILDHPVSAYRVYRGTQSGVYNLLEETQNFYYTDTNILENITYYYVITALSSTGESKLSNEISAGLVSIPVIIETENQTITEVVTETEIQTTTEVTTQTEIQITTEVTTQTEKINFTETKLETITDTNNITSTVQETLFPFLSFIILVPFLPRFRTHRE